MSPMAAPCARPPVILEGSLGNPLGLDSGPAGSLESDLVAEPVPVPVAIPHVLTRRVAVRVRDKAGLVPKLSGPIWHGDGGLTTDALPHFPPHWSLKGPWFQKFPQSHFFNQRVWRPEGFEQIPSVADPSDLKMDFEEPFKTRGP